MQTQSDLATQRARAVQGLLRNGYRNTLGDAEEQVSRLLRFLPGERAARLPVRDRGGRLT